MDSNRQQKNDHGDAEIPAWLGIVQRHVASLRFGVVQVVVHDSRVVQIEKTEKLRIEPNQPGQDASR